MTNSIVGEKGDKSLQYNGSNLYTKPVYKAIVTYPLSKDELNILLNNKTIIDTWGVAFTIFALGTSISFSVTKPDYNMILFWISIVLWIITILILFFADKFDNGDKKEKINDIKEFFRNVKDTEDER